MSAFGCPHGKADIRSSALDPRRLAKRARSRRSINEMGLEVGQQVGILAARASEQFICRCQRLAERTGSVLRIEQPVGERSVRRLADFLSQMRARMSVAQSHSERAQSRIGKARPDVHALGPGSSMKIAGDGQILILDQSSGIETCLDKGGGIAKLPVGRIDADQAGSEVVG